MFKNVTDKNSKKATMNYIQNKKIGVYTFFYMYIIIRELDGGRGGNYNGPLGIW